MVTFLVFLKALVIAFFYSAAIGPVALLCVHRATTHHPRSGYMTALGAVVADLIYAIVAVVTVAILYNFMVRERYVLEVIGGAVLAAFGFFIFSTEPPSAPIQYSKRNNFMAGFFLALTNIGTLAADIGLIIGLKIHRGDICQSALMVLALTLGPLSAWFITVRLAEKLKAHLGDGKLFFINRIAGFVVSVFGIFLIMRFL